jgi:hypothetical protein
MIYEIRNMTIWDFQDSVEVKLISVTTLQKHFVRFESSVNPVQMDLMKVIYIHNDMLIQKFQHSVELLCVQVRNMINKSGWICFREERRVVNSRPNLFQMHRPLNPQMNRDFDGKWKLSWCCPQWWVIRDHHFYDSANCWRWLSGTVFQSHQKRNRPSNHLRSIWFSIIQNTITKKVRFLFSVTKYTQLSRKLMKRNFEFGQRLIGIMRSFGSAISLGGEILRLRKSHFVRSRSEKSLAVKSRPIKRFECCWHPWGKWQSRRIMKNCSPCWSGKVQIDLVQLKPSTIRRVCACVKQKRSDESVIWMFCGL